MVDTLDIEKVRKLAKKDLLKIEGVVGVSPHHSVPTIRIYVESLDPAVLKELPEMFLGYKVEVVEVGKVYALDIDRKKRWRPIFPGISIGSALITAGTLGQICIDNKTNEYCILSNRHVFWGDEGTPVYQPGPYDGGTCIDTVGYITRYEEVKHDHNIIDAAIASLEVEAKNEAKWLGSPVAIGEVKEGQAVFKEGRSSGYTTQQVIDTHAIIKVRGYPNVDEAVFEDVIITYVMALPGDSGSPVFTEDGKLCGLVFAGSNKITVICKAKYIVEKLNITPLYGHKLIKGKSAVGAMAIAFIPIASYFISKRGVVL